MDTVILAAGKGTRLSGVAPPFHKPLMVVNGSSLVRNAASLAYEATGEAPIIVVAPENALPIAQVLEGVPAKLIVQRHATGPAAALKTGMELVKSGEVLVLMADNVITQSDIAKVYDAAPYAVGVREVPAEGAERFTRLRKNGAWVEKTPVTTGEVKRRNEKVTCWVGPLLLDSYITRNVLSRLDSDLQIGPPLLNAHAGINLVAVDTYDIGVPEANT